MIRRKHIGRLLSGVVASLVSMPASIAAPAAPAPIDRSVLPPPPQPFTGVAAMLASQSTPAFPAELRAPEKAPNILVVMTDDVGFAASSAFGGSIPTPALDALAQRGLRYNNFHTTAMCSPSRAALLTGRNHHAVGMGTLSDYAEGYPGYNARIPKSAATIAEVLRQNGFSTAFFGKHHDIAKSENSIAGPLDRWPNQLGFEYFYGFIGSQTDQWNPALIRDTTRVEPVPGEVLDKMLIDDATRWIHNVKAARPDKPFFIYLAPGTAHAPLQAPPDWIARFRGRFDQGWDKTREEIFARQKRDKVVPANARLTPRPFMIPAWSSLSDAQRRIAARLMEVYAAQLAYQDDQFGKLIAELKRMGELDNTLVVFVEGDNGASAEGGNGGTINDFGKLVNGSDESDEWLLSRIDDFGSAKAHAHYPAGWAWAMNTPFQLFKRFASHLGGMTNGMVVSWPAGIKAMGEVRPQFTDINDVMPTILEAVGVPMPTMVNGIAQQPIDGISMMPTFASAKVPGPHRTQYFEMLGNRAIYQDGWLASTLPPPELLGESVGGRVRAGPLVTPLNYEWQLFDLRSDYSQSKNLAQREPARLAALQQLWDAEARRNNVYPINNAVPPSRGAADVAAHGGTRDRYTYWGADVRVPLGVDPPILSKSYTLTAQVTIPVTGGTGVIAAYGNHFGGWSFYLDNGVPVVAEAFSPQPDENYVVRADRPMPAGPVSLGYSVTYRAPAQGADVSIMVDGRVVAEKHFARKINRVDNTETFDIGRDSGGAVTDAYGGQGVFPGSIDRVDIDFLPGVSASKAPDTK